MNETALIGAGLGMIPKVGPLLSGVYKKEVSKNFNKELLAEINNIENKLTEIKELLAETYVQTQLNSIIVKTNNAEQTIEGWWSDTNGVKDFYKNNDLPIMADTIKSECEQMLTHINTAITSTDGIGKTWVQVYIDFFIYKVQNTALPQDRFKVSCVELTYRAFLHLVQLQIKGIMCLRATNCDNLEQITLVTLHNIIQQGIYVQEQIIDPYLESTHSDYESFNWFLQNNTSPNQINIDDQQYLSTATNSCDANTVAGGIEFDNNTTAGTSPTGLRIASSTVDQYGDITSGSWNALNATTSFNLKDGGSAKAIAQWSTDDVVLTPGQIITGITMNTPSYTQSPHLGVEGHPNYWTTISQMSVTVDSCQVKPDGSIVQCSPTNQAMTVSQNNSSRFSLYQLGFIGDSGNRSTISSSPITGFGFCLVPGGQSGVKLQTSIHAKAFTPYGIQSSNQIAIGNQILNQFLSGVPNPISSMNFGDGEQAMVLQGLSSYAEYGNVIEIGLANSPTSQLTLNSNHTTVGFDPHPPAGSNLTKWVIRDPLNFQYTLPDQTSYGNAPSEKFAFNWSPVILQSAANEKLCLSLQKQTHGYLLQSIDVTVVPPVTTQNSNPQAPKKDVGNGQLVIGKSNFIWNFHLLN